MIKETEKSIKRRQLLESGHAMPLVPNLFEVPSFFKDIQFRPVCTVSELKAASNLVYEEYLKLGYVDPNLSRFKFSVYQTIPHATTHIAVYGKSQVIGTLTTMEDSPLGLPSDQAYKLELDALRKFGRHLVEGTLFAFNNDVLIGGAKISPSHRMLLVLHLIKGMFSYLRCCTKGDDFLGSFHPKHEALWKFIQTKPLGELKSYAGAKGSPSIARHIYIPDGVRDALSIPSQKFLFGGPLPDPAQFPRKPKFRFDDLNSLYVQSSVHKIQSDPHSLSRPVGLLPTLAANIARSIHPKPSDVNKANGFLEESKFTKGDCIVIFCPPCEACQCLEMVIREKNGHVVRIDHTLSSDQVDKVIGQYRATGLVIKKVGYLAGTGERTWDQLKLILSIDNLDTNSADEMFLAVLLSPPVSDPSNLLFWEKSV